MPVTRTTTRTEHTLTEPVVLSTRAVYLSGPDDDRGVIIEQVTIVETTNGTGDPEPSQQILVSGYVIDADGARTDARVYSTPVSDPGQRANLLAHIARDGAA